MNKLIIAQEEKREARDSMEGDTNYSEKNAQLEENRILNNKSGRGMRKKRRSPGGSSSQNENIMNENVLVSLIDELEYSYNMEKIPTENIETFKNSLRGLNPKIATPIIAKEIHDVSLQRSIIQV